MQEIAGIGTALVDEKAQKKTRNELGWLGTITEISDPERHLVQAAEFIKRGYYPIFYANHTHHANISGFLEVVKTLRGAKPDQIFAPIARSLVNVDESKENQETGLIAFAQAASPLLADHNMYFVPVPRVKDIRMALGLKDEENISLEMLKEHPEVLALMNEGKRNKQVIFDAMSESTGVMLFPEETTEGGVFKEGSPKGIQEVPNNFLGEVVSASGRAQRDIVLIPLGMNGYNDLFVARESGYDRGRLKRLVIRHSIGDYYAIDLGKKPLEVVVGKPLVMEDLERANMVTSVGGRVKILSNKQLNHFLMQKVAEIVDPKLRGTHA